MSRFALFRAPLDQTHAGLTPPAALAPWRAEPRHIDLSRGGVSVRVNLTRHPTARRIYLRVRRRNGEVVMTLPREAEVARARDFAAEHFDWIAARLARRPQRTELRPGSTIPLRGEPCAIVPGKAGAAPRLRTAPDGTRRLHVDPENAPADVRAYLERAALSDLRRAVARYAAMLDVRPTAIQLKDTSSRWGSCSSEGRLCFSWRLALAPSYVLDYLAAHEVTHLRDMTHSSAYWSLVRGICPRTDEAEAWLRENDTALYSVG